MAHGHSHGGHHLSERRRRLRTRMGATFRLSIHHYHRQRIPVFVRHFPPVDQDMGHRMPHDNSVPSGGKWPRREVPPPPQGKPNCIRCRLAKRLVLATSLHDARHSYDSKARHRGFSSRLSVWRRTCRSRRDASCQSGNGSRTRSSTSFSPVAASSRGLSPPTGRHIRTSTASNSPPS